MELTPEQKDQVGKAKAEGQRRVMLNFTPEQRSAWTASVKQELLGKEENSAHLQRIMTASQRPGFFGDIRRAIVLSGRPVHELAAEIGIEPAQLSDFRAGDADSPSAALERLIELLNLRLMQEIPK
jgi:hypothetical protein